MANKIKLGARPASFTKTVEFDMLEGTKGAVECTFKYRTRSEFGQFIDKIVADAKAAAQAASSEEVDAGGFSMAELMERTRGNNAAYLLDALKGWNLDEPLNAANAATLCDEFPGAAAAIMEAYRAACVEGRVKN